MDIFRIIGIAFVGVISVAVLKNVKGELAVFASIATGAVILIAVSPKLVACMESISSIADKSGLSKSVYSAVIRILGIGYITEYAAGICNDHNCESIGKKVQFSGKIIIFVMALPIINEVVVTLEGIM